MINQLPHYCGTSKTIYKAVKLKSQKTQKQTYGRTPARIANFFASAAQLAAVVPMMSPAQSSKKSLWFNLKKTETMNKIKILLAILAMMATSCATVYQTTSITVEVNEQIKVTHDLQLKWSIFHSKIVVQSDSTIAEHRKENFIVTDSAIVANDSENKIYYKFLTRKP
ncbi:MAG: hypothetical protein MJZ03_05060 [archaeon]|nr:hypothetical protein [archaeon]